MVHLIRLLDMQGLWSSGIPELKRFIFILQEYMKWVSRNLIMFALVIMNRLVCPRILHYFDDVGYDISIIVSKWFITLFAYVGMDDSMTRCIIIIFFCTLSSSSLSSFTINSLHLY